MTTPPPLPPPPPPGAPIGRGFEYYTDTAPNLLGRGFDLRVVVLEGKNPAIGGAGWHEHATADPVEAVARLHELARTLGPRFAKIDGLGGSTDRHTCFDIDHPEHLPPELAELLSGGLRNDSRPGRWHAWFRNPPGATFSGRKELIDAAFPPVGGRSWGEVKGFHGQARIWSPIGPVLLMPGPIPDMPDELAGLCLPPGTYAGGGAVTDAELGEWIDERTEAMHPGWLEVDAAKAFDPDRYAPGTPKHKIGCEAVWQIACKTAAGFYTSRDAFAATLEEFSRLTASDEPERREREHAEFWRGAIAKLEANPQLVDAERERVAGYGSGRGGGAISWNPDYDEDDAWVLEYSERFDAANPLPLDPERERERLRRADEVAALDAQEEAAWLAAQAAAGTAQAVDTEPPDHASELDERPADCARSSAAGGGGATVPPSAGGAVGAARGSGEGDGDGNAGSAADEPGSGQDGESGAGEPEESGTTGGGEGESEGGGKSPPAGVPSASAPAGAPSPAGGPALPPDLWLPDSFWDGDPQLQQIRLWAISRRVSPDVVLAVCLARVGACTPHVLQIPPDEGSPLPLGLYVAPIGRSGAGKSTAMKLGRALVTANPKRVVDPISPGSGEAIPDMFFGEVEITDKDGKVIGTKRQQIRFGGIVEFSEGSKLFEQLGRKGSTIGSTLRGAFTGDQIGEDLADKAKSRHLDEMLYVISLIIGFQPEMAKPLLTDEEIAAGTPQRFLFVVSTRAPRHVLRLGETRLRGVPAPIWDAGRLPSLGLATDPSAVAVETWVDFCSEAVADIEAMRELRSMHDAVVDRFDSHEPAVLSKLAGDLALLLDYSWKVDLRRWVQAKEMYACSTRVREWVRSQIKDAEAKADHSQEAKAVRRQVAGELSVADARARALDGWVAKAVRIIGAHAAAGVHPAGDEGCRRTCLRDAGGGPWRALTNTDRVEQELLDRGLAERSGKGRARRWRLP